MNRLPCVALLCLISFVTAAKAAEEAKESDESSGTIVHVTLYRDRALVTREIPVPAGKNLRSLTVPGISSRNCRMSSISCPSLSAWEAAWEDSVELAAVASNSADRLSVARR